MTKDFRHIGLRSNAPPAVATPASASVAKPERRLNLRLFLFIGLVLFASGFWLLFGGMSPLPPPESLFLGFALMIAGLMDFAAFAILRQILNKPRDTAH
ncbi:MAG: hypothetical protein N3C63_04955 [Rhodocyclaceae bacterium]|nr:hypothetical protein [Rhodocyclaceae bacterium]